MFNKMCLMFGEDIICRGEKMSYSEIDNNKCKSCYLCIFACPNKLIKKSETLGKSGEQLVEFSDKEKKCTACRMCAMSCPDNAIIGVYKE
mgnify:CR=1 FL=1